MKIGIVSDTHGNLPAFKSVLEHMDSVGVDIKVHLGDIIGYGAYPNECVELTVENFNYIVMGNHDLAAVDLKEAWGFNSLAQEAIKWTAKNTTEENKSIVKELKGSYLEGDLLFSHGSPDGSFRYIDSDYEAQNAFIKTFKLPYKFAFVGHTHVPDIHVMQTGALGIDRIALKYWGADKTKVESQTETLPDDRKTIVNVGSVGQPRDYDPRASYAIFNTETNEVTFYKIPYDINLIVAKMQRVGLPTRLYMRLLSGQ